MKLPGPSALGRGVVTSPNSPVPPAWADVPAVVLAPTVITDDTQLQTMLEALHLAWVQRQPQVIVWNLPDSRLPNDEPVTNPVWQLDPMFLPPMERLAFLVFSNNYDGRHGEPAWWWAHKAQRALGARRGSIADVVLPDGREVWIDGGPRQSLPPFDCPVISGESVDLGKATFVSVPSPPKVDGLAADQLEAVGHTVGASRVVAPAGSGKTRTLVARLRHLLDDRLIEPDACVTLAYNAKAADELRTRLGSGRDSVRTIHSLGWEILRDAHGHLDLIDEREVRNRLSRLISVPRRPNSDPMAPFIETLNLVRDGLRDPRQVETERDDVPGFADMFDLYRADLYSRQRVDHGEQVYGAIEALLRDKSLRNRWQGRYRHVLVDEFQDLTPSYLMLIRLLAAPRLQVFGVGDDDQVIYGYAGADPGFLIDFDDYFPGAGHHALETNYRCPPAVVTAARHLLGYNRRRIDKTITAGATATVADDALTIETLDSDSMAEAAGERIATWLEAGVAPTDIAVLARVNSSLIPVKAALAERGMAVNDLLSPHLLQRTLLRALFAWIRIALEPTAISSSDALEAIRRPARGLSTVGQSLIPSGRTSLDQLIGLADRIDGKQARRWRDFGADLRAAARIAQGNDALSTVDHLITEIGLGSSARALDSGRTAARSSHYDELTAVRRAAHLHSALDDLEPWLEKLLGRPRAADGITLSTVHRVKGMEWRRVIVFGADRGSMPHDLADDMEEERRVFHVALTRALDQVVVLAAEDKPSRFLAEMDGTASVEPEPRARQPVGAAIPRIGDAVRVRGGYTGEVTGTSDTMVLVRTGSGVVLNVSSEDLRIIATGAATNEATQGVVDALRAWRRETSQRLGVPAYVVFDDKTMHAIAQAMPTDENELISVPGIGPAKLDAYGDEVLAIVDSSAD